MNDDELRDAEAILYSFFEKMVELDIEAYNDAGPQLIPRQVAQQKLAGVQAEYLTSGTHATSCAGRFPPSYLNPNVLERKQIDVNTCEFVVHFDRSELNKRRMRFRMTKKKLGWRIHKGWEIWSEGETATYL